MDASPNIAKAVGMAAQFVQAQWQQAVMGTLPVPGMKPINSNIGLRQLYSDSIILSNQLRGVDNISQRILATKKIAEQIERGCGPFDMKPSLLGGPKARIGKNGRYNIIPFRHGVSEKYSPNNNFPTMPQDIYKKARQLKASVKQAAAMKWGGKLTGTEIAHPAGKNPTTGYQHKSGRFENMVRIEKTYKAATQSKYMTFRVVSDKSADSSWWHPGYDAHNIAKAVSDYCRPAVEAMIRDAALLDLRETTVRVGLA